MLAQQISKCYLVHVCFTAAVIRSTMVVIQGTSEFNQATHKKSA